MRRIKSFIQFLQLFYFLLMFCTCCLNLVIFPFEPYNFRIFASWHQRRIKLRLSLYLIQIFNFIFELFISWLFLFQCLFKLNNHFFILNICWTASNVSFKGLDVRSEFLELVLIAYFLRWKILLCLINLDNHIFLHINHLRLLYLQSLLFFL